MTIGIIVTVLAATLGGLFILWITSPHRASPPQPVPHPPPAHRPTLDRITTITEPPQKTLHRPPGTGH